MDPSIFLLFRILMNCLIVLMKHETLQTSNKGRQKNVRNRRSGADGRQTSGGSNTGRRKSAISGQSESESEDDELSETNELTLTNIARF